MKHPYHFAGALLALAPLAAQASAPLGCWVPGDNPHLPAEMRGPRHTHLKIDKLGDSLWDNTDGHDLREVATHGELRVLAILVNFDDVHFSVSADPRQTIDDMLNQPGFSLHGATGSAYDFYQASSLGQFSPVFDVYGPMQLSRPEVDYVQTDEKYVDDQGREHNVYPAGNMVEEAIRALDDQIDYSVYDANSDGMVDFVYIFFPGKGATTGGSVNTTIWPHAYTLTSALGHTVTLDGVEINRYATSSELGATGRLSGIGTFCHEFAHVLGLPDLYDTGNNGTASKCFTPGRFSTMCAGNYNNDEHTPPLFSAYESYALEWLKPVDITGGGRFTLLPVTSQRRSLRISAPGDPQEYFLFECRARDGWDSYLESEGLAVWHIDFDSRVWADNAPNNDPDHQRIDLVEADFSLSESTRSGDLFPGTAGVCEFITSVSPAFLTWNNTTTGYEIEGIERHPDGAVSFTVVADNGSVMPGAEMAAPAPHLTAVGQSSASLAWEPVEGAANYVLALWAAGADPRQAEYSHIELGNVCSATADGLEAGRTYNAVLYACGEVNNSRQARELVFTTQAADFANTVTRIYPYSEGSGVRLDWDAVEGAGSYLLTVALPKAGETSEVLAFGFDGSVLPEGFEGNGSFETRSNYCGSDAPSWKMSGIDGCLRTPRYDSDIKSVSMWVRQRFGDADGRLDLYAVAADGTMGHLTSATDFTTKGERITIDIAADGVRCLAMVYTQLATGLDLFVDDLQIALCDGPADTPLGGYDALRVDGTSLHIDGLDSDTQYAAWVVPVQGQTEGARSERVLFTPATAHSGVQSLPFDKAESLSAMFVVAQGSVTCIDPAVSYDVYAADGRCVARNARGTVALSQRGIYIVRSAGSSLKIKS